MKKIATGFLFALVALSLAPPCTATTIIIVRTRNLVIIASDSKAQYQGAQGRPQVCKIAKQNETYFVVAGIAQDTSRGFLANRVISNAIARGSTFDEQADAVESDMLEALARELGSMRTENPEEFKFAVTGDAPSTIGLVTVEGGVPKVVVLSFIYDHVTGKISVKRDSCPGTCDGEYSIIQIGHVLPPDEFAKATGSPTQIATKLVQMEIDREPREVGPPIEVLEIRPDESLWLQDALSCSTHVNVREKYPHNVTVTF